MEHFFQNIQGWFNFDGLYHEQVQKAVEPAHFVEVGVWKGKSAAYMLVEIINSGKNIKFDLVDTWQGSLEHQNDPEIVNNTLYDEYRANLAPVRDHYTERRMTSIEAAALYDDNSLDFVLIDASHEYLDVKADILAWLPKVKPGGTLAGDDILWPGVLKAVDELLTYNTKHGAYWRVTK